MKLYEFVDRLYEMGDMESPKTVMSKKTLNESLNENNLEEDDLDEGILGGLAGAALGGAVGNGLGHPVLGAIGGGLAGSAIQNALFDDLDEEPEGEEQLNEETEEVTEDKDLSTVKGSMTQILQDNREKIDACGSAQEVHDVVAELLAEADLDTPATRRLLMTLKKQKGLVGALQAVYNSILKGSDLGVIKEECSVEIKEAMELAEAKQEIIGKFYTMMEEFMIDTDDQVEYLLDFIADEDLQRLMDEFLEYME